MALSAIQYYSKHRSTSPRHDLTSSLRLDQASPPTLALPSRDPGRLAINRPQPHCFCRVCTRPPPPGADPRLCASVIRERGGQHIVVGEDAHCPAPLLPQPEGQRTSEGRLSGRRQAAEDAQCQLRPPVNADLPSRRRSLHVFRCGLQKPLRLLRRRCAPAPCCALWRHWRNKRGCGSGKDAFVQAPSGPTEGLVSAVPNARTPGPGGIGSSFRTFWTLLKDP